MSEMEPTPAVEAARVFDSSKNLRIKLPTIGKTVAVRWPDDEIWRQYDRRVRAVQVPHGDGKTVTRVEGVETAAQWLIKQVQLPAREGEQIDLLEADEAAFVVARMLRRDCAEPEHAGNHVNVKMTVFGGIETLHSLRLPSIAHTRRYGDLAQIVTGRRGRREVESDLGEIAAVYDELMNGNGAGYKDPSTIPNIHKSAVLAEVMSFASDLIDEGTEEDFFE